MSGASTISNDGAVDLILANGHPDDMIERYSPAVKYREPLLLFHQENGKLRDISRDAGPAFAEIEDEASIVFAQNRVSE